MVHLVFSVIKNYFMYRLYIKQNMAYGRRYKRCYPYKKRYRNKRSADMVRMPSKPLTTWQKLAGVGEVIQKGASVASMIYKIASKINSELKYVDTDDIAHPFLNNASLYNVTTVGEGLGQNGRVGISQLNHSLTLRGTFDYEDGTESQVVRMIIFVWNLDASVTAPTEASILESTSDPTVSPLNIEDQHRFSVIRDRVFTLTADKPVVAFKEYIRLNPLHSKYSGTTPNTNTNDHVYIMFSSNAPAAMDAPNLSFYARVRYYDN